MKVLSYHFEVLRSYKVEVSRPVQTLDAAINNLDVLGQ